MHTTRPTSSAISNEELDIDLMMSFDHVFIDAAAKRNEGAEKGRLPSRPDCSSPKTRLNPYKTARAVPSSVGTDLVKEVL
jgi:hypothetical protein